MSTFYYTTMQEGGTFFFFIFLFFGDHHVHVLLYNNAGRWDLFFGHLHEHWLLANSLVINAALRLKRLPTPELNVCSDFTTAQEKADC